MDLSTQHHQAVALVGTVPLPSPYPASGEASFVLTDWDGETVIYVKLVQVVNQKRIITRFVKPENIVAIRIKPEDDDDEDVSDNDPQAWTMLNPTATRKEIETGKATIIADAKAAGVKELEEVWHTAVILYVHETAPVLHRHEAAVTAAVSAESLDAFSPDGGVPCC